MIQNSDPNFTSEKDQLLYRQFLEAMTRCESCEKRWQQPRSLFSPYYELVSWIELGRCPSAPDGIDPFKKTLDKSMFKQCQKFWLEHH